ncbi:MAG: helix-turn-helix transcriptional regulator [Erysipelotrichales bacterium]|nr:helix-turn-helix transcriptional regulator [Erysipelotrichales bacterium]
MEFHEKLQELRKAKGLTQEELAKILFVSRTAISKWEGARGYPSIDSLKDISTYFSVSIDDLLSGDTLITLAERENKNNIHSICDMMFTVIDLLVIVMIFLPMYPKTVDDHIYAVNLMMYTETTCLNRIVYWIFYLCHILLGSIKLVIHARIDEKWQRILIQCSMILSSMSILYLALAREAYAVVVMFMLLILKGTIILKRLKVMH